MENAIKKYFEDIGEMQLGLNLFIEKPVIDGDEALSVHAQKAKCKVCGEVIEYFLDTGAWSVERGSPIQNLYDHYIKHLS